MKANTGTIKVPAKIDGATMWFDYKTRVKAALLELTDYPLEENQVWAYYNKYGGRNVELSATTTFDLINTDYFRGWKCRINYVSQVGPADALAASVDYVLTSEPYTTGLMNFSSKETYENYTFLGWSEDRNAATATYDRKGVHGASRITLTKDKPVVTLWAVWQGDYHIVLNIVDETITYGESILVEATVTDGHGNPVSDGTLKFGFNGQEYGEIVQNGNVFSWEIPTVDENNKNAGIIRKGLNYIYAIYTTADGSKSFDSRGGYIRLKPLEVTPVLMSDNCVWSPAGISTNQIKIGFVTKDDSETVYQLGCFKTVKDSDGNTVTSMQTAGQYTVDVTELLSGGPFVADKDMVQLVDNKSLTFTVEKLDLGDASVIIEPLRETKVYDGSPVSTDASLYSIKTVEDGQIYCIDSGWQAEIIPDKNSTEAGTAYVQISANPDAQNIKGSREVTLTIVKAQAEITGTTAYNKIYGDEDFNLSMVKTGEEGTLNYAVISGEENLSVTEDGTVTIKKAGTSVIRVSMAETNNYMAAEDVDVTISIAKAAGSGSVTLEDWVYSPDGSTVKNPTVLSDTNGTDQVTCLYKVKDADDSTYTTEQPVNAGVYTVKAIFAATDNYLEASAETDFVIEKAEKPENTPEGENTKIEASATMESLKDIVLPDGWSWTDDSIKLIPGGTVTATAVYEDTANYKEHQVEIQIYKAEEVVEDDETEKETDDTTDDETEKETDDKTDDETEKETDGKTDDETEKETNGKNNHQTNNKPNNKPNNKTTSPKTGDESPIGLYVLILLAGAVGMAGAVLAKKKENKKIL